MAPITNYIKGDALYKAYLDPKNAPAQLVPIIDAIKAGGSAAFLSIDMAIAWVVFMVWVVFDARRIGMGTKWGWFFVLLSYIGVSMAFPFYLITRERFLDGRAKIGKSASSGG